MTGEQNLDLTSVTIADIAEMVAWGKGLQPQAEDSDDAPAVDTVEGFEHVPPMYCEPVVATWGKC